AHVHTLQQHPDWSALAAALTRAIARGWTLPHLLGPATDTTEHLDLDELLWRAAITLDPQPDDSEAPEHPDQLPPDDLDQLDPHTDVIGITELTHPDDPPPPFTDDEPAPDEHDPSEHQPDAEDVDLAAAWSTAMLRRQLREPLQLTEREIERQLARAWEIDSSPIPERRLLQLNAAALEFYRGCYPGSWARAHLIDRFGDDLTSHAGIRPGYAPDTWTALVTHLTRRGATDEELLTAGLATRASTGRLIDRFRDRVLFPITREEKILGFVGRRHPDATDTDRRGPKYLNTGDTLLYRKGDQLYVAGDTSALKSGLATPVLVEGPMDAIAVTLASPGRYLGVAALGTSLTTDQARQLATWPATPIIATDNDPAGQRAAERDFWLLTPYNLDPLAVTLSPGHDPASIYASIGPEMLVQALDKAAQLGDQLLRARQDDEAHRLEVLSSVIAARPAETWGNALLSAATRHKVDHDALARVFIKTVTGWSDGDDVSQSKLSCGTTSPRHEQQRGMRIENHSMSRSSPPGSWLPH
ncbi:MAG: toprim domain-containing protein, partial [Dokdonella sp.]